MMLQFLVLAVIISSSFAKKCDIDCSKELCGPNPPCKPGEYLKDPDYENCQCCTICAPCAQNCTLVKCSDPKCNLDQQKLPANPDLCRCCPECVPAKFGKNRSDQ